MRWIKWALLAISFLLPLAVADPARAVTGKIGGGAAPWTMEYCDNLKLEKASIYRVGDRWFRSYQFTGQCHGWSWQKRYSVWDVTREVKGWTEMPAKINGLYFDKDDPAGFKKGHTTESVTFPPSPPDPSYTFDLTLSCNFDPWLSSAAECKVTRTNIPTPLARAHGGLTTELALKFTPLTVPFSRGAVKDVLAYIKKQTPPPAPIIVSPVEGQSFQGQVDKCVKLVIDFQESGWYGLYIPDKLYKWSLFKHPKEAAEVELSWEWFVPTTAKWDKVPVAPTEGTGRPPGKVAIGEPGPGAATRFFCLPQYVEGAWRVGARHLVPGWPWSQWRQFWLGEPVAYGNPTPVVVMPKEGAYYPNPVTGGYVYPVDVLVEYTKTVQKATGQDLKLKQKTIVELQRDHLDGKVWLSHGLMGQYTGQTVTINHTEGKWRARARLKVFGQIKQPWSDWTVFYVGPAGLALLQKEPGAHIEPPKVRVK